MSGTFDPSKHLRQLRGKGGTADYLDVKHRIAWFRSEHPDGTIISEHVTITDQLAVFKATVTTPAGGATQDYGSETPKDFGDYIEKASTKAIGRALALMGYGTQFVTDFDMENADGTPHVVDSPVASPQPRSAPERPQHDNPPQRRSTNPAAATAALPPSPAPAAPTPIGAAPTVVEALAVAGDRGQEEGRRVKAARYALNQCGTLPDLERTRLELVATYPDGDWTATYQRCEAALHDQGAA